MADVFIIRNMPVMVMATANTPLTRGLKDLREMHGYSLRTLGELTDISYATIANWENGRTKTISADNLSRLARAYHMPVAQLMDKLGLSRPRRTTPKSGQDVDDSGYAIGLKGAKDLPPDRLAAIGRFAIEQYEEWLREQQDKDDQE